MLINQYWLPKNELDPFGFKYRPFGTQKTLWRPKTDQTLIFGLKRCAWVPYVTTRGYIGVNLSVLVTQQWMAPFWIPICAFQDTKGPLEAKKLIKYWYLGQKRWARLPFVYTEGQIGVNLSELISKQWMEPFWIGKCAFLNSKGLLENQKLIKYWFLGRYRSHRSPM